MKNTQLKLNITIFLCPYCGEYPKLKKVSDPFGEVDHYWSYGCDCTMVVNTNRKAAYDCYCSPDADAEMNNAA